MTIVSDDAVSPVIGVILMVAITVVLAAIVFVLVGGLGSDRGDTQLLGMTQNEGDDSMAIARAPPGYDWNDYDIRVVEPATGVHFARNAAATGADPTLSNTYQSLGSGVVVASDYISLCADVPVVGVTVQIRDVNANSIVNVSEFRSIDAC